MRISELSARSGVSIASIKYYLREGLLTSGQQSATNQADYGEYHAKRLRLIRSLIDIGGLSISKVRATLAAMEDETAPMHDAFGAVMHGLDEIPTGDLSADVMAAYDEVQVWLRHRNWKIEDDAPAAYRLAELVATLRRFGFPAAVSDFDNSADFVERTAEAEVHYARSMPDRTAAVETMLIGTVIYERALVEVRRLALEAASFRLDETN
ncbi:MerR family transcriptional regulator [Rhodococcus sp. ACPA4]|uniref:MerR family transcriptional regulator n=1 Tax=Rhodococcus TaxID=1827 RepID=UPI000BB14B55|nr:MULTISPECIES: MerR family transcriptional regulator [unclassified Rhodococcus (in: high G+C Gram-positive bacteria)]PBC41055.1 MerR family transcriptional regulator [Rhodococcus sp. ACPA4]ROZ45781.1 MerR family transcriptional regulator [Rhodococcus sp. WS3]